MAKDPKKKSKAPAKSMRPQARPTKDKKPMRPRARPADLEAGGAVARGNRAAEREARENPDRKPKKKMGGGAMKTKKYAKGGTARGMGAATKGGKYSRAG